MRIPVSILAAAALAPVTAGAWVLVEAESFTNRGGWAVDTQFVEQMGSPFLLAHGLGAPVAHAQTAVSLPSAGVYRVWVRTRDWIPDHLDSPGRFRVALDGVEQPVDFGTVKGGWAWQDGGAFTAATASVAVELRDQTGFDGRCDALAFGAPGDTAPPAGGPELTAWRRSVRGEPDVPPVQESFDFVVVGGGVAGSCAAVTAARAGLSVALIQDRPYFGGNASEEIRVHPEGAARNAITASMTNSAPNGSSATVSDDVRRRAILDAEPTLRVFPKWRAYGVVTNGTRRIAAVDARHTETGETRRFLAPLFADCSGDAWLGYWAGAAWRMGREARAEFGESLAPTNADAMTLGSTLMWSTRVAAGPRSFPAVPWALTVAGTGAATSGGWNWEYGMNLDTIADAEQIRDHLLRAIYGNFSNAKTLTTNNANRELDWVPYVAGKRESRRLVGDYTLTQGDIQSNAFFEDAIGTATWSIDLHRPTAVSYLSVADQTAVAPYYFPFRSLCCRDVPNLMMAGRCLSATHVALGSPRVMLTGGQMGVAVGCAAALCRSYGCEPRDLYRDPAKTTALQQRIGGYFPAEDDLASVVDNADPECTFTGTWQASTSVSGYYGTNYVHDRNTAKGSCSAQFDLPVPTGGMCTVCLRWTAGDNRASNVPVDIVHAGGTNVVVVDQRYNGGVWMDLGTWDFAPGVARVTIRNDSTDGYVMADAAGIRGDPPSDRDTDHDGLPDWWERWNFLHRTRVAAGEDSDGDGGDNLYECVSGTDPTAAGSVFRLAVRPASGGNISLEWPSASNRVYRVDRTGVLAAGYELEADHLPATPPTNVYITAVPPGAPGLYRVICTNAPP